MTTYQPQGLDALADAFRHRDGARQVGIRQQDKEFLSPIANGDVLAPDGLAHGVGHVAQHHVAHGVAVGQKQVNGLAGNRLGIFQIWLGDDWIVAFSDSICSYCWIKRAIAEIAAITQCENGSLLQKD